MPLCQRNSETHQIPFVSTNDNPANLAQARPIEDFCTLFASKLYDGAWQAENVDQLRSVRKIREIDVETTQDLMRDIRREFRVIEVHGPLHLI